MTSKIRNVYLLDTNIVSMLARAKMGAQDPCCLNVLRRSQAIAQSGVAAVCSVTLGEIEYGLSTSPAPMPDVHRDLRALVSAFPQVFVIDKHVAVDSYAKLRARLFAKYAPRNGKRRTHTKYPEELIDPATSQSLGIQENDLWIAAVALTNGLTLVTADKMLRLKDVLQGELSFEDWTK